MRRLTTHEITAIVGAAITATAFMAAALDGRAIARTRVANQSAAQWLTDISGDVKTLRQLADSRVGTSSCQAVVVDARLDHLTRSIDISFTALNESAHLNGLAANVRTLQRSWDDIRAHQVARARCRA
jgi:hypothetical protein